MKHYGKPSITVRVRAQRMRKENPENISWERSGGYLEKKDKGRADEQ